MTNARGNAWQLQQDETQFKAISPDNNWEIAGDVAGVSLIWRSALSRLGKIELRLVVRSGQMYYLYSLNEVIDTWPVTPGKIEFSPDGLKLQGVAVGVVDGANLECAMLFDPILNEMRLAPKITKTGPGARKFQFQYVLHCPAPEDIAKIALLVPGDGHGEVWRPFDQSDQAVRDQDHHNTFPKTICLPQHFGLLSSFNDKAALLFQGGNLRYAKPLLQPFRGENRTAYYDQARNLDVVLYGADADLKAGEFHTETFSLRLIKGIGGLSASKADIIAGTGALLQSRYAVSDAPVCIGFTSPSEAYNAEVAVKIGDEIMARASGMGDILIPTAGIPDGNYAVVKRMTSGDKQYQAAEPLTVLRQKYNRFRHAIEELGAFVEKFRLDTCRQPDVAGVRLDLIRFKLSEAAAYMKLHEIRQVTGVLKDARRAMLALQNDAESSCPEKTELIYQNDTTESLGDFRVFGFADITFSPAKGMYLKPTAGTVNLWSKFTVAGSFAVEFDYLPLHDKGGTMLQLCAAKPDPGSDYDYMCSASYGSMDYYMFGLRCYHFSFSRGRGHADDQSRVCNFRKTGHGFYSLSSIRDPITDVERWYRLLFAKEENHFMFFVDGRLVQEYFDEGNQGPVLEGGHIGIRNWSTYRSYFKNLAIYRIKQR